jgi:VanZ family protein
MTAEELSQAFFPSRTLDLLDGVANLAGAALGGVAARQILRPRRPGVAAA